MRSVKKYECPHVDCNATMQGKDEYDKHFQTHDKPFRYQCKLPDCGKEFRNPSSFSKHKKFCQYKLQIERKRKCHYCAATIQTGQEYSKHLETHKEHGLYKCTWSTCGKKWRTLKLLRQHYEKHQPKLQCEICGSFFSYKRALGEHKKQYHEVRVGQKYKCRYCNATMQTKEEYSEHLETQKEYNCTWLGCEMKFCSRSALQQHHNIHQPRPQCENCGYLFPRNRTLRIHQQRCHGGSRKFHK
uniref:Zinc finger protein n=1 Tax=Loa loa TaxID=7209 RepID=A0A1I7V6U2_LOALO